MQRLTLHTLGLLALVLTAPSHAIITRHDVEQARYRDFGEKFRQILVQLGLPAQADGEPMLYSGMGTLIAPNWIITAAHAVEYMRSAPATAPNGAYYVFVKGRGYRVKQMIIHPAYNPDSVQNDIALIQLEHDVREAQPACLYENSDEKDKVAALVGTGISGNGLIGPGVPDGALLGATVRIDTADGTELTWLFRGPKDPRTTPLEGISGPGDSGGPALIEVNGKPCVAGISSQQRIVLNTPPSRNADSDRGQGRYGVTEVYTRVSRYIPWIRATQKSAMGSKPSG